MKITQEKLDDIIAQHKIWLEGNGEGKRADLRWADLSGADLRGVDFSYATLFGANLCGADLQGADLSDADFRKVVFSGAVVSGVNIKKIKDYETTEVWINYRLVLVKELVIRQKMIETQDKNLAILYKNTWMADDCKKILKKS